MDLKYLVDNIVIPYETKGIRVYSPQEAESMPDFREYIDLGVLTRHEYYFCSGCNLPPNECLCDEEPSYTLDVRYNVNPSVRVLAFGLGVYDLFGRCPQTKMRMDVDTGVGGEVVIYTNLFGKATSIKWLEIGRGLLLDAIEQAIHPED